MTKAVQRADTELPPQWATFIGRYLETGNARQSAIDAGFSDSYANTITTRFPDKVRSTLRDALESKGITSEKIAEKVNELLEAKTGDEPNYQAIDKGISHAVKIRGDYSDEPPKSQGGNTYNFIFSAEVQEDVKRIEARIKERLTQQHVSET